MFLGPVSEVDTGIDTCKVQASAAALENALSLFRRLEMGKTEDLELRLGDVRSYYRSLTRILQSATCSETEQNASLGRAACLNISDN